nr:MAG TPA: hypothetical protein [Bacteriophage sp.]
MINYKEALDGEISTELEVLESMETNSEDYKIMVEGLTKLIDRSMELEKIEISKAQEAEKIKNEGEKIKLETKKIKFEAEQAKTNKIFQWIGYGISAAGIVIPVAVTIWGTKVTLNFEKEGTVTTMMGRGFINKLLPKK